MSNHHLWSFSIDDAKCSYLETCWMKARTDYGCKWNVRRCFMPWEGKLQVGCNVPCFLGMARIFMGSRRHDLVYHTFLGRKEPIGSMATWVSTLCIDPNNFLSLLMLARVQYGENTTKSKNFVAMVLCMHTCVMARAIIYKNLVRNSRCLFARASNVKWWSNPCLFLQDRCHVDSIEVVWSLS